MTLPDDNKLLLEYAQTGAENAFATLVQRYAGLVYSAALRQIGNAHDAEDVTQAVFIVLARKAKEVAGHPGLSGWLLKTTHYATNASLRTSIRRAKREKEATMLSDLNDSPPVVWTQLAPHLDEAMASLGETDRAVLAMRYFENKTAAEIGQGLKLKEEAAKKRANRAIEKLRSFFAKKGIAVSAGAIAAAVSANAVQAAPSGLAAAITGISLSGATITSAAILASTRIIAMTTIKKLAVAAVLTASIGSGLYAGKKAVNARAELEQLRIQQAPSIARIQQLEDQHAKDTNLIASLNRQLGTGEKNNLELLKLRGEVGTLRNQLAAKNGATTPSYENAQPLVHRPGVYISVNDLAFSGYATPEAALESITWTMLHGTYDQVTNNLSGRMLADESDDPNARKSFEAGQAQMASMFKGLQIVAVKAVSDDRVEIKLRQDYDPEKMKKISPHQPEFFLQPMAKVGNEWKIGGSTAGFTDQGMWDKWAANGQIQTYSP